MKQSKKIVKDAGLLPRLKLFYKTKKGLISTGIHKIKLVADKEVKGTDYNTAKEVDKVRYLIEENGEKKTYERNKFNKNGDVDYLVIKLADFEEGTEILIEGTRKGIKNVVSISPVVGGEEIEVEEDEEGIEIEEVLDEENDATI